MKVIRDHTVDIKINNINNNNNNIKDDVPIYLPRDLVVAGCISCCDY